MKLHLPCRNQNLLLRLVLRLCKCSLMVKDKITISFFLYFFSSCLLAACNSFETKEVSVNRAAYNVDESNYEEAYRSSNELLNWLDNRVDILVKYKANCRNMAFALVKDQNDYSDKLKVWRS